MKYRLIILLLIFTGICLAQVNGIREDLPLDRIKLRVWGTHEERGYAQGYLLAEEAVELFENYVINNMYYGSSYAYGVARGIFINSFEVDEEYMAEFAAMLEGIVAAGESIYFEILGREIDAVDIAMVNAVVDLMALARETGFEMADPWGCSTLTSWGEATIDDPLLQGNLLVTRHLDWNSSGILDDFATLLVCQPSETDEQAFITFTYPLFVTALSATNESGLTCFMDVGSDATIVNNGPYQPVLLRMRQAIEKLDYDGSGACDPQDMVAAITESNVAATAIITVVQSSEQEPLIIEKNNGGQAVRTQADNDLLPVIIGDNLVATNHYRLLHPPLFCPRYTNLAYEIEGNSDFSAERQWNVLATAAGQGTWTRMTIQVNPVEGECLWASTYNNQTPSYNTEPTVINLYEEFQGWRNIPDFQVKTTPAFLFLNEGTSLNDVTILQGIAPINALWGDNAIMPVVFLNEYSPYVIPEYDALSAYFGITELPQIIYNGNQTGSISHEQIGSDALDALLPSAGIDLQIRRLDTATGILAYTVENLGIEEDLTYQVACCYVRPDNATGISWLAENWFLAEDFWGLAPCGSRVLYELQVPAPANGWAGVQVLLTMIDPENAEIRQSAISGSELVNPLRLTYNGERWFHLDEGQTSIAMDTLTFFNEGTEPLTLGLQFSIELMPAEVTAITTITTAGGEESTLPFSEAAGFDLLPGEYLYLQPNITGLDMFTHAEFTLTATWDLVPENVLEIPFSIYTVPGTEDVNIPVAACQVRNYPNPFNPETRFIYELPENTVSDLVIYNLKGQEIDRLKGLQGKNEITWKADIFTSGIYFYRLEGANNPAGKMLLLK
ncbi:MAG: T9SS type A sorting domain-containing protein [Candidatus Cloacimonetes bacterium]|nr:T9SS type A sorting domain-containing protein [Candidatus Cloacimonadota bacterium]